MLDLGGDDGGRCPVVIERNGKPYRCELRPLHTGDHEATEAGRKADMKPTLLVNQTASQRLVPRGLQRTPGYARMYAMGAVHYATGLGLDRLAKDLGGKRHTGEADHDLSLRLTQLLGVTP